MKQDEANSSVKSSAASTPKNASSTKLNASASSSSVTTKESLSSDSSNGDEKQMVGGCCVCADDTGYSDNQLVYCDGLNCLVAVHQACYGIPNIPSGPWYCKVCELKTNAGGESDKTHTDIVI